tara:strand:- start:41 stop:1405 length:1365 start_codon:yes stop_codon:yes gene_type:complete
MGEFKKNLPPNNDCNICIIGLGYVGLPLAVEFTKTKICKKTGNSLNRKVIGFDINKKRISELGNGHDNTLEIKSNEIEFLKKIFFTCNINDVIDSDVFIVTVPTPIDSQKIPDLKPLKSASEIISKCLNIAKENSNKFFTKKKIILFESTVYPGATEEICIPIIEKITNLKKNIDFVYGYSPERINPGDQEHRLSKIIKVTSGSNEETRIWVDEFYGSIIEAGTFSVSNVRSAEASKVIENTQRDLNIALINELALIFQKMGLNTEEILNAASTKWNFVKLFPGLVGGHCIGVDPYYLTYKARQMGYSPNVILSGRKVNDAMGSQVAKILLKEMVKRDIVINSAKILILGFSFKQNCPDFRNTGVVNVINELKDFSCDVSIYDPLVDKDKVYEVHKIKILKQIPAIKFNAVLIAVGHSFFKELGIQQIKNFCYQNAVILDLNYLFKKEDNLVQL